MITDPNYNLPKDAFIRLFDNPIPAGSPDRQAEGVPEWAQDLDEVVVWAHMGDNGAVSVKVNGEDIGGGGGDGFQTAIATFTNAYGPALPCVMEGPTGMTVVLAREVNQESAEIVVPCVCIPPESGFNGITGEYIEAEGVYIITGNVTIDMEAIG